MSTADTIMLLALAGVILLFLARDFAGTARKRGRRHP